MAVFDDPNLVSCAGLGPVVQLAERAGLQRLAAASTRATARTVSSTAWQLLRVLRPPAPPPARAAG